MSNIPPALIELLKSAPGFAATAAAVHVAPWLGALAIVVWGFVQVACKGRYTEGIIRALRKKPPSTYAQRSPGQVDNEDDTLGA